MTGWVRDGLKLAVFGAVAFAVYWLFRDQAGAGMARLEDYADSPWAVLIAALVFLLGSLFLVPQWALIAAAIAAFGLVQGGVIAWVSVVFAAQVHLAFATLFRERLSARVSGPRRERLQAMFSRNSFQSGLIVRLIPTGPFVMVNVAAGLAGVRAVPFMAGTMIGIVPKILLTGLVAQGLLSSAQGQRIGLWLGVAALAVLATFLLNRWVRARRSRSLSPDDEK